MGGTSEDAGAAERDEKAALEAAEKAHAAARAKKFAALDAATDALRLSGEALSEACAEIDMVCAVAKTIAQMGIGAGKAAMLTAGVAPGLVELAGKLAEKGIDKARGKIAGAS